MNLLVPGRFVVTTDFQAKYIGKVVNRPLDSIGEMFLGNFPKTGESIDRIVFAITSINKKNSRYHPVDDTERVVGVDRFAQYLNSIYDISSRIVGIPDFGQTQRFAEIVLDEVRLKTEGEITLNPENTVVLCSTPEVIELFEKLGYTILPAELSTRNPPMYETERPGDIIKMIAASAGEWSEDGFLLNKLSAPAISWLRDYPQVWRKAARLFNDPLLTDDGSLTETRNYDTYAFGMGNTDIIRLKYNDIRPLIKTGSGRIVDEGCADGTLLELIAKDFPDADLIGIDASGEFIERCNEKLRVYRFGRGTHISFEQRNILFPIFEADSIDVVISNSTGHEIWSYGNQEESVKDYLALKYNQLAPGGRLIMRDVVGPNDKDREVYLWCNPGDGKNGSLDYIMQNYESPEGLASHLNGLSTKSRFIRFAADFLSDMRKKGKRGEETEIKYRIDQVNGVEYFVVKMKDAAEFIETKDYTDNWESELNEEFTFWNFNDWKQALSDTGFSVIENPNNPSSGSHAYLNPWMVKNRYEGAVKIYEKTSTGLQPVDYPVTNMVLVGEKI